MTSKKKLLSIVAVLLLIGLIAVPAIAGGATEATEPVRGTVDYDGVYLSALGLLIFLGSALAVYLIVKKRKFMFKPLVDEVIPMSEPVDVPVVDDVVEVEEVPVVEEAVEVEEVPVVDVPADEFVEFVEEEA